MANDRIQKVGVAQRPSWPEVPARTSPRAEADSPSAEPAGGEELKTGLAPPFRALLGTSRRAAPFNPVVHPEPAEARSKDWPHVSGYEIVAELGRGGMGVVYLARHCSLKRLVALKMILAGSHADSTARRRFRTEAEAVARLQHAHVVQIYELGEYDGRPFLALEYVAGGSLLRKVAGTPQPEREAAQLVETLARAVHYTHQRGILHRDLKPNNILLTAEGLPKITDFGLAKVLDAELSPTRSETLLGTPSYMAPEQAGGESKKVGAPADVYSLGAILYELLTGRVPFQGTTLLSILEQVRTQEPLPPRRLRRSVSVDLETICLKCLQKEPSQRYASAEALAEDLHCFLEEQPIQARPVPIVQRLWKRARRRPALLASALAAVALVGLLLSAWSSFQAAEERAQHRAAEKYQQFLQHRNEALIYGLLAPEEGGLFLGTEADATVRTAEMAARRALALAGMEPPANPSGRERLAGGSTFAAGFPAARRAELAADCYTLLLVLASLQVQKSLPPSGQRALRSDEREKYQEALRLVDRARQLGFQTQAYHGRRAHFLELLGQPQEARQERDRAAALPPEGALDHFLIGEEHYRHGEFDQAMTSFNRALTVQPSHFWAQFFLAVCYLKTQQWSAAKAGLNACLTQQPDFVWAYLLRSFANDKIQAHAEAEADFQKALQLHPQGRPATLSSSRAVSSTSTRVIGNEPRLISGPPWPSSPSNITPT